MKKIFFALLIFYCNTTFAQSDTADIPKSLRIYIDSINNSKINTFFGIKGNYKTMDRLDYNFDSLKTATFYFFGFSGCHQCEYHLPYFFSLAEKHPLLNFVYISFDSYEIIQNEINIKTVARQIVV